MPPLPSSCCRIRRVVDQSRATCATCPTQAARVTRVTRVGRHAAAVAVAVLVVLASLTGAGAAHAQDASPYRVFLPSLVRAEPTSAGCRVAIDEGFESETWQASGGDVKRVTGGAFAGAYSLQMNVADSPDGITVRSPRFMWAAGRTVSAVHVSAAWRGSNWNPLDARFGDHFTAEIFGETPLPYMTFLNFDSYDANRGWAVQEHHVTDPRELAYAQFKTAEVRIVITEDSVERTTWWLDEVTVTVCTE